MFQRLNLTEPLDGTFGGVPVRLVDVSAAGALLITDDPPAIGTRAPLRFSWRGTSVEVAAEARRADDGRTGVSFVEESAVLRGLIAESVRELLRAQEANATGDRDHNIIDGDATLTAAAEFKPTDVFMTYRLTERGWKRSRALLPDQPPDGFTLRASVPDDEVDLLCRTYESGDPESRRLTRLLAELSVAESRTRP